MSIDQSHNGLQLVLLVSWLGLGLVRMVMLYVRGVRVVVVDRQKTVGEGSKDLVSGICLGVWWYELVAYALPLRFHVVPSSLRITLTSGEVVYWLGILLWLAAIVLYALAILSMGDSWRIGIDRMKPGALVTHGIFGYSRNPIYVSFDLAALATFLCTGQLHFLMIFLLLAALLHDQIRREEEFLATTYGKAYADYQRRVRRYL